MAFVKRIDDGNDYILKTRIVTNTGYFEAGTPVRVVEGDGNPQSRGAIIMDEEGNYAYEVPYSSLEAVKPRYER